MSWKGGRTNIRLPICLIFNIVYNFVNGKLPILFISFQLTCISKSTILLSNNTVIKHCFRQGIFHNDTKITLSQETISIPLMDCLL